MQAPPQASRQIAYQVTRLIPRLPYLILPALHSCIIHRRIKRRPPQFITFTLPNPCGAIESTKSCIQIPAPDSVIPGRQNWTLTLVCQVAARVCAPAPYRSRGLQHCSTMSIANARSRTTSDVWSHHEQYDDNMSRHSTNNSQPSTRPAPGMPPQTQSNGYARQKDNGMAVPGMSYRNGGGAPPPQMFDVARSPPGGPNKSTS